MDPYVSKRNCRFSLVFKQSYLGLQGYIDANMAKDVDGKKSIIGYVYTLGGIVISWGSKL